MPREDTPDYYEILDLEDKRYVCSLSHPELKAAYKRALLRYHPDKFKDAGVWGKAKSPSITVDDIALAFKTLSEPHLKVEYDKWLENSSGISAKPSHTGLETVDLDELAFDEDAGHWSRGCRCGESQGYLVSETELEKNAENGELIVGCKGCSLWLRVLYGVEE